MPTIDPVTGKRASGHAQRKSAGARPPRMSKVARQLFYENGPSPANPLETLAWARRLLAIAAWLVAIDQLDAGRARSLKELVFAMGATHDKSKLEETVNTISKHFKKVIQPATIKEVPGHTIVRPPTARGMGSPRLVPVSEVPDDK